MLTINNLTVFSNIVNFCEREQSECELKFYISDVCDIKTSNFKIYVNFQDPFELDDTLLSLRTPLSAHDSFLNFVHPVYKVNRLKNELTEQFIEDIYFALRGYRIYCFSKRIVLTLEHSETSFYFTPFGLERINFNFMYAHKENQIIYENSLEDFFIKANHVRMKDFKMS